MVAISSFSLSFRLNNEVHPISLTTKQYIWYNRPVAHDFALAVRTRLVALGACYPLFYSFCHLSLSSIVLLAAVTKSFPMLISALGTKQSQCILDISTVSSFLKQMSLP